MVPVSFPRLGSKANKQDPSSEGLEEALDIARRTLVGLVAVLSVAASPLALAQAAPGKAAKTDRWVASWASAQMVPAAKDALPAADVGFEIVANQHAHRGVGLYPLAELMEEKLFGLTAKHRRDVRGV
jgi:hypothetical protein